MAVVTFCCSTPELLEQSLEEANRGGYALGVKLVRGAYHSFETARYASLPETEKKDPSPPVWEYKDETDRCYNLVRVSCGAFISW